MVAGSQCRLLGPQASHLNRAALFFLTLVTGTRKMEYKGSSWHETCFVCHRCQQPIGTKSFIPKDEQNFCVPCYEKQYALQCVQCRKVYVVPGPAHWAVWLYGPCQLAPSGRDYRCNNTSGVKVLPVLPPFP